MSTERAKEGHLSTTRQALEMGLMLATRRVGPGYYHMARMWRRDMPLSEKLRHVDEETFAKQITQVNNASYLKISQHKIPEKAMLSLFQIPTPEFLAFCTTKKDEHVPVRACELRVTCPPSSKKPGPRGSVLSLLKALEESGSRQRTSTTKKTASRCAPTLRARR